MTRIRMNHLLERHAGIGVITTNDKGNEICYFYQDFDSDGTSGIKRAMAQLYPLHDKGIIKTLCFIERAKRKEGAQ